MYKSPSNVDKFKAWADANSFKAMTALSLLPVVGTAALAAATGNVQHIQGAHMVGLASLMIMGPFTSLSKILTSINHYCEDYNTPKYHEKNNALADEFFDARSNGSDKTILDFAQAAFSGGLLSEKQYAKMVNEEIFNKDSSTVESTLSTIFEKYQKELAGEIKPADEARNDNALDLAYEPSSMKC
jgi:hypothetical protein